MANDFVLALEITTLGMGLVFAALILLWLMMALLTYSTSEKESASPIGAMPDSAEPFDQTQGGPDAVMENNEKARAAAIAVAFALVQEETGLARPLSDPPTAIVSAWQLGMRTKQLYQKGERIKRQTRKIGS
jgi:Na+-transporting methylmalonyl-CoA/oxaloacetate decarboxylase gamma subunit